jgi:hypothetical protein
VYAVAMPGDPWEIVFVFYAAMNLAQAYLETKDGERFEAAAHWQRKKALKLCPELRPPFLRVYEDLRDLSEQVRYDPGYQSRPADHNAARDLLGKVESFIVSKLKTSVPEAFDQKENEV